MDGGTWQLFSFLGNIIGLVVIAVLLTHIQDKYKKDKQSYYLLKSIGDATRAKVSAWGAQINLSAEDTNVSMQEIRLMKKARDEFSELANLAQALEKPLEPEPFFPSKNITPKLIKDREIEAMADLHQKPGPNGAKNLIN